MRTSTRAGRDGAASERKSRTGPPCAQYGQRSGSAGRTGPASATGASHRGQASVPPATRVSVPRRRSLCSWIRTRFSLGAAARGPARPVALAPRAGHPLRQVADRDLDGAVRHGALAQLRRQVVVVALEALARDAERGRERVELLEALVADHVTPALDRPADVRVLAQLVDQDRHAGRHGGARVRLAHVDAFLAVASKREVRRYADTPIPPETERRILEAGRVTGSSKNRQPWRFVVLSDREAVERAAEAVWAADNVLGAALVIAVIVRGKGPVSFDAGRAAQNMMLAAW